MVKFLQLGPNCLIERCQGEECLVPEARHNPTFCDLAAAKLPAKMQEIDGRSLLPLLENPSAKWADRELVIHCGRWNPGKHEESKYKKCAVRTQEWRFVDNKKLYNITTDPGEKSDVASAHPEVVAELRKTYEKWWNAVLPLMVNEGLPKVGKGEHPLALRYEKQLKEKGIPDWMPAEL